MTIPLIYIKGVRMSDVTVPNIFVPNWQSQQPNVDHLVPPVVLNIGNPIVDMPGCVKAHQDNQYHKSGLPVDRNLVEDDPDKAMIVCDATVPSYDAMNYEPEQLIFITEVEPPAVEPPPEPPEAEAPDTGDVSPEKEFLCPAPNQPRVGDLTQKGDERVIGHEEQEIDGVKKILPQINRSRLDEILVVDGGSTDGTLEFVKECGFNVIIQSIKGHGGAILTGVQNTKSENIIIKPEMIVKNSVK